MTEKEVRDGHERVLDMDPPRGIVELIQISKNQISDSSNTKKQFTFDAVYDWNSQQNEIYNETARPLVDCVLEGFNCTIFAYGQTGTGKTYTMEGLRNDSEKRGIIPNSFEHIFNHIARSTNQQYLVRASYLEIYQEEIRDLLSKDQTKRLELKERADTGVYVKDLLSFVCKSVKEIEHVMTVGNQNRSVGATNMNEHSSRSHAIFIITVEHSEVGIDGKTHIRVGKLNLVDLAGSERQAKTGTVGQRQKEAIKINLSLSALGNVISSLVDSKSTHVPYRDSKLTRLLQDSLGGNSKTVMVANVGPASYNYEETLTTLRYANRAKNIKNKPRVNQDPKDALLREFQTEIERLKQMLLEKKKRKSNRISGSGLMTAESSGQNLDSEALHKLAAKIEAMESKLLTGGKNIVDHTNEQEKELERKRDEIAAQKRREREILQQLEAKEENELEVKETFTSLTQEAEIKRKKLKKLFSRLQSIKAEIRDLCESNAVERRDLEEIQSDLMKDLKLKYLIIDNFIPVEEKSKLLSDVVFDEDQEDWKFIRKVSRADRVIRRPISDPRSIRPITSYSKIASRVGPAFRYRAENIMDLELIVPPHVTREYDAAAVSPRLRSAAESTVHADESDIEIDATQLPAPPREFKIVIDKKSGRPKTASGPRSNGHATRPKTGHAAQRPPENDIPAIRPDTASYYPQSRGLVQKK